RPPGAARIPRRPTSGAGTRTAPRPPTSGYLRALATPHVVSVRVTSRAMRRFGGALPVLAGPGLDGVRYFSGRGERTHRDFALRAERVAEPCGRAGLDALVVPHQANPLPHRPRYDERQRSGNCHLDWRGSRGGDR